MPEETATRRHLVIVLVLVTVLLVSGLGLLISTPPGRRTPDSGTPGSAPLRALQAGIVASFTVSPSSPYIGQSVNFDASGSTDSNGTIVSYDWTFGDGSTGTGVTTTHAFASAQTYDVTLTVTDNATLTNSTSSRVTVIDLPPTASFTFSPSSPVAAQAVSFNASASSDLDGTITSYAWTFGDGASGGGETPAHSYAFAGTYTVTLTVTDNGGMTGSQSQPVSVSDAPPTAAFTFSPSSPVASQKVSFDGTASSDVDGTITNYAWTFGDGATGAGAAPMHKYATNGTYPVTLTVTDNGSQTGSVTHSLFVGDAPPNASFTFTPTAPVAAQTVAFDASASSDPDGTITAYAWTFGDGSTASGVTVNHAYAASGTYTVTLTVTDNAGLTGNIGESVTVGDAPPTASFAVSPAAPVARQTVTFDGSASSDIDGTITNYAWTFGDGSTSSGAKASATHAYTSAGTYTVTLTVTDNAGLPASTSKSVVVADAPPVPSFTSSPASPVAGQTVTFDASASFDPDGTITRYAWAFGDGSTATVTKATTTHAYALAGAYTVTLSVTDNAGLSNATSQIQPVVSGVAPLASFSFSPALPVPNATVTFNATTSRPTNSGSVITAYSWTFGDGTVLGPVTSAIVTHIYSTWGPFTVTLKVTDSYTYTNQTSKVVVVDAPPVAAFSTAHQYAKIGRLLLFNGSMSFDPDGLIVQWTWNFGDGGSAIGMVVNHAYASLGTFNVTLTVVDNKGLTASIVKAIQVVVPLNPVAAFSFSPSVIVVNESITFNGSPSTDPDGAIVSYSWLFADGTNLAGMIVTHSFGAVGSSWALLLVTDEDGNTSSSKQYLTVLSGPTASFTVMPSSPIANQVVTFTATATADVPGGLTYNWTFGDGKSETGPTVTHTYLTPGSYTVTLRVTDAKGISTLVTHKISVGAASTTVAPNPVVLLWWAAILGIVTTIGTAAYISRGLAQRPKSPPPSET